MQPSEDVEYSINSDLSNSTRLCSGPCSKESSAAMTSAGCVVFAEQGSLRSTIERRGSCCVTFFTSEVVVRFAVGALAGAEADAEVGVGVGVGVTTAACLMGGLTEWPDSS